jgi:hypothetical protein
VPHYDRAGEETDDPGKADQLADEVGEVAVHEDEAGLFDRVAVEGLVEFEQVAQAETRENAKCYAEKE